MPITLTTTELTTQLQNGEITAVELTQAFLNQIECHNNGLNIFLHFDKENSLQQAENIDTKRAAGTPLGKLAGIPIALKDIICTKGIPTTCGSKMLQPYVPPYDAHIVTQLKKSDAILIGKVNMDEFAMGSSTENSAYGVSRNPWNKEHSPGGSSGGSAAAVAAGMSPLAIGTDTGGSIRQPAAFCGVVGMKPTYGRVSRYGCIAFASSLDQIGPMSNDVAGAATLLEVIAGHDPRDTTSLDVPVPTYSQSFNQPLEGLRIGIATEHFTEGLDDEVNNSIEQALDIYRSLGAEVKEISLPHSKYAVAVYYIIAPSEASSNLARYDGVHYGMRADEYENMVDMYFSTRGAGFGDEVKRRIMLGTFSLSSGYADDYYLKALKVRRLIRNDFDVAFENVDLIISPVTPTPAFKLGAMTNDPLAMYLSDIYTISANLAGIPAISIPAGLSSNGLPIGLQLQAPALEEERLLRAAYMFESATDWHKKRCTLRG
ncbi:Aspartyl-tRNA(Asn) amidotransferase subunit A @ Glutamyl-tRNA(Gln) amidotransferase subunit A [hydrothermal vent metagenome]|uniref:glutaminyl-tRNA synthase (glutamine-hydrolyzing) n=1 Tax=hydrothermal vent metagenome TaxID=652676 RepID=A0A3B1E624_9ZZZZ